MTTEYERRLFGSSYADLKKELVTDSGLARAVNHIILSSRKVLSPEARRAASTDPLKALRPEQQGPV